MLPFTNEVYKTQKVLSNGIEIIARNQILLYNNNKRNHPKRQQNPVIFLTSNKPTVTERAPAGERSLEDTDR